MSFRLEMLQVARLAPNMLHDAADRVTDFLRGQFNEDGGCMDRSGKSDLYYTVFALEGLHALRAERPIEAVRTYLQAFGDGDGLDLVHLACLARCWASMPNGSLANATRKAIITRLGQFRTVDGGYDSEPEEGAGSIYDSFLAYGAHQDLQSELPEADRIREVVETLKTPDGGYANEPALPIGTTPVTAAAVTMLRHFRKPIPPETGAWLLAQCHAEGGFLAMPRAPFPDLLSTATALHALSGAHVSFDHLRDRCLDFIDSLWTGKSFCGHWADDEQDAEYTYYALLALGHLSL